MSLESIWTSASSSGWAWISTVDGPSASVWPQKAHFMPPVSGSKCMSAEQPGQGKCTIFFDASMRVYYFVFRGVPSPRRDAEMGRAGETEIELRGGQQDWCTARDHDCVLIMRG